MTDFIRSNLQKLITENETDMSFVSTEILKKNHSYLFGFLKRRLPEKLPQHIRWQLVAFFQVPPATFFTDDEIDLIVKNLYPDIDVTALIAAAEDAQCDCSVKERHSGHKVGCWMPALSAAIAKAKGGAA